MANKKFTIASEFFTDKKPIEDKIEKPKEKLTKTIILYVTEEFKDKLKIKASFAGRTVTGYIKYTLKKYLNEKNIIDAEKFFKPKNKICLNVDVGLYLKIKEEAQKNDRSINNFILQILMNDIQR